MLMMNKNQYGEMMQAPPFYTLETGRCLSRLDVVINVTSLCSVMTQTFLSFKDLLRSESLFSEARVLQYCFDVELRRPHQYCEDCQHYMELTACWSCSCCYHFLHLFWVFCYGISVADAARILPMNEKTVRSHYKSLRQYMSEDLRRVDLHRRSGNRTHC